jgi:hypothetical protein
MTLDSTSVLLLGALLALVCCLLTGAGVLAVAGAWARSWLSGFDDIGAKREGGKVRVTAVIVDKARPVKLAKAPRPAVVRSLPERRAAGDDS